MAGTPLNKAMVSSDQLWWLFEELSLTGFCLSIGWGGSVLYKIWTYLEYFELCVMVE
jgi:hypothetical protein